MLKHCESIVIEMSGQFWQSASFMLVVMTLHIWMACNLVFGIWYLVFGIWYLVFGIYYGSGTLESSLCASASRIHLFEAKSFKDVVN